MSVLELVSAPTSESGVSNATHVWLPASVETTAPEAPSAVAVPALSSTSVVVPAVTSRMYTCDAPLLAPGAADRLVASDGNTTWRPVWSSAQSPELNVV